MNKPVIVNGVEIDNILEVMHKNGLRYVAGKYRSGYYKTQEEATLHSQKDAKAEHERLHKAFGDMTCRGRYSISLEVRKEFIKYINENGYKKNFDDWLREKAKAESEGKND